MATGGRAPVILHFAIDAVEAMAQAIHRLSAMKWRCSARWRWITR